MPDPDAQPADDGTGDILDLSATQPASETEPGAWANAAPQVPQDAWANAPDASANDPW